MSKIVGIRSRSIERDTKSMVLIKRLVRTYLRPYFKTLGASLALMILAAAMTGVLAKMMEPIIVEFFTA